MYFSERLFKIGYKKGEVIYEKYEAIADELVNIKYTGIYEVLAISGGGQGIYCDGAAGTFSDIYRQLHYYGRGGTGGLWHGKVRLQKGIYLMTVGAGTNTHSNYNVGPGIDSPSANGSTTKIKSENSINYLSISGGQGLGTYGGSVYSRGEGGSANVPEEYLVNTITNMNGLSGYGRRPAAIDEWGITINNAQGPWAESSTYSTYSNYGIGGGSKGSGVNTGPFYAYGGTNGCLIVKYAGV